MTGIVALYIFMLAAFTGYEVIARVPRAAPKRGPPDAGLVLRGSLDPGKLFRHGGAHTLEPHDEKNGGNEITCLDRQIRGEPYRHQEALLSPRLRAPLALNISSMRSVTT